MKSICLNKIYFSFFSLHSIKLLVDSELNWFSEQQFSISEIHGYYFIIEFLFLKDIRVAAIFSHFSNVKTTDTKRGCGFTSTFIKWLCKHTPVSHIPTRICKVLCSAFSCCLPKHKPLKKVWGFG